MSSITSLLALTIAISSACDLKTGVYEIFAQRGVDPYKRYLSVNPDGTRVDLYTHNDASGRQEWRVTKTENGYYNIQIASGVSNGRNYLSVTSSGDKVDLWPHDDNSGRQRWILLPIEGNPDACNVEIASGIDGDKSFLSVPPSGNYADLWYEDDNSGRQQWIFKRTDVPAADCDLETGVYEVLIQGGTDPYKRHLSVTPDGRRVDLWTHNDASGRQEWRVEKTEYGYYHIKISSGVGGGRDFLSVSRSGKTVDLWPYDDASGRQRWVVLPIEGNKGACNVKVYGGIDSDRDYGTRSFLSVPPSGKYTDLWYKDDNSGRQQWIFTRID